MIGPAPMSASTSVGFGTTSIAISRLRGAGGVRHRGGRSQLHDQRQRRHLRLPRRRAVAVGRLGSGRGSGAERMLPRMSQHQRHPSRRLGLLAAYLRRAQDHQPVHVGPRLGYAWDRWMIFATGGWASANLKGAYCVTATNLCDGPGSFGNGASRNNNGWYAGGGFDYMVHKGALVDVILGVEYQHFDVSSENAFCALACDVATGRRLRPQRQGRHRPRSADHQDARLRLLGRQIIHRVKQQRRKSPGPSPGAFSLRARARISRARRSVGRPARRIAAGERAAAAHSLRCQRPCSSVCQ